MADAISKINLLPGETLERALLRRVKMHEFLIPGGVMQVDTKTGEVTYSDEVEVATTPVCPWHDADCPAWAELRAGRGTGTTFSPTIVERRESYDQPKVPKTLKPKIPKPKKLADARDVAYEALAGGPVPDEIEIEGDEHDDD